MISHQAVDSSSAQLGQLVAEKRSVLGLTQEQLASKAGVSSHTLLDFESGRGGGISLRNLMQILSAAQVDALLSVPTSQENYADKYLAPWKSERNQIELRVGDTPARARARLEKKRRILYGRA
jgi:transcriptional regulator with XRE-family HTH domain